MTEWHPSRTAAIAFLLLVVLTSIKDGIDPGLPILLALLDCRELLQKLVEKKERTKVISTEVVLNEKENKMLDNLEV